MFLACIFGHDSDSAAYNGGVLFGACYRCGRSLIKAAGGRWHSIPRKYVVVVGTTGQHAVSPRSLLRKSRKRAPLLHRLRRRRRDAFGGYFD